MIASTHSIHLFIYLAPRFPNTLRHNKPKPVHCLSQCKSSIQHHHHAPNRVPLHCPGGGRQVFFTINPRFQKSHATNPGDTTSHLPSKAIKKHQSQAVEPNPLATSTGRTGIVADPNIIAKGLPFFFSASPRPLPSALQRNAHQTNAANQAEIVKLSSGRRHWDLLKNAAHSGATLLNP